MSKYSYGKPKTLRSARNWRIRRVYTDEDNYDAYSYKGGRFKRDWFWIAPKIGSNRFKKNRLFRW